MCVFIRLTDVTGKTIYVNTSKIRYIGDGYAESKRVTCLHMDQYNLDVLENPEEVFLLVNNTIGEMLKQIGG